MHTANIIPVNGEMYVGNCFVSFLLKLFSGDASLTFHISQRFPSSDSKNKVACRKYYDNATAETRRQVFDEICDNFSPGEFDLCCCINLSQSLHTQLRSCALNHTVASVFRFFFLEYFSSSMEAWYTARMSYTRSCAVNSIVGHILGIGDRHTQNILVHTKTGEIVHIDFGIVFEQGKVRLFFVISETDANIKSTISIFLRRP